MNEENSENDAAELKLPETKEELEILLNKAKLAGFILAANTANHEFNNTLGGPATLISEVSEEGKLPSYVINLIPGIKQQMTKTIGLLRNLMEVKRLVPVVGQPNLIDIEKSIQPEEPTT